MNSLNTRCLRVSTLAALMLVTACQAAPIPATQFSAEPSLAAATTSASATLAPTPTATHTPTITPTPQPVMITAQNAGQLHQDRQLKGHTHTIYGAYWSPDGSLLATTSQDGRVILWDTLTWEPHFTLEYEQGMYAWGYPWSPDGTLFATLPRESEFGDTLDHVLLWDVSTGQIARTITMPFGGWMRSVGWSPDGAWFAASVSYGPFQESVLIFNFESGELLRALQIGSEGGLEWSPDGKWLATGEAGYADSNNAIRSIRSPFDGSLGQSIMGPSDARGWPQFSQDWSLLAFSIADGSILLYDQQGQPVKTLDQARLPTQGLAWSPDGTLIAGLSDHNDGYRTTMVWDVESGQVIATLRNNARSAGVGLFGSGIAWSPDQTMLISFGGSDTDPTLWMVEP